MGEYLKKSSDPTTCQSDEKDENYLPTDEEKDENEDEDEDDLE